MSPTLINRNTDLKRLRDEGYDIEVVGAYLLIKSIPYVNQDRRVERGVLVTSLELAGDKTVNPIKDHKVMFSGEHPCDDQGAVLKHIQHTSGRQELVPGLVIEHQFSAKPRGGYSDYFAKMSAYANIITKFAKRIDPDATAQTFAPVVSGDAEHVFEYLDTASSRADIQMISEKLTGHKVAVVGLGGTGSYVLDLLAKTPVDEIRIVDGDYFFSHNAFRSPGAASLEELRRGKKKAEHFHDMYSVMHRRITPIAEYLTVDNLNHLEGIDFVFLSLDDGEIKRAVMDYLIGADVPFIDSGIGLVKDSGQIRGQLRVTIVTSNKSDHVKKKIPLAVVGRDNPYITNIQVADLNALCASLAVIRWKKYLGFYADLDEEHNCTYVIDGNCLLNDESTAQANEAAA